MLTKRIAFISGVARSGTSALVEVLNANPYFYLGMERYYFAIEGGWLKAEHFEKDRFLDVQVGDTHGEGFKDTLEQRANNYDGARIIGDKYPLLYKSFEVILQRFPDADHVYIVRNPLSVMESYFSRFLDVNDDWDRTWQLGLEEWNSSIQTVLRQPEDVLKKFHFLIYENFFSSTTHMNALYSVLGASPLPESQLISFVDKFKDLNERPVPRNDELRLFAARHADWASYNKLLERAC